jgi:hypothetical protein
LGIRRSVQSFDELKGVYSGGGVMKASEFRASALSGAKPEGLTPALLGLWTEARGDWNRAHEIVQEESDRDSAWVHAYLHRKEGDLSNARYWYRRAARPEARGSHEAEWNEVVEALLGGAEGSVTVPPE